MKTAVVLFNLGGPDSLGAVRPFLFNLFFDKAIIRVPLPIRFFLATLISRTRKKKAQEIYGFIGGKSPILEETKKQANALEFSLKEHGEYKIFIAMRYWHPRVKKTLQEIKKYSPDKIVLLPLYPQFSTTTTSSSFEEWERLAKGEIAKIPTKKICCYPTESNFIKSHVEIIKKNYSISCRILFSAHGLPEKIIKEGDPYQWQVEKSVADIVSQLTFDDLDYAICYQSRVGPLKWIGPSTEEEIKRAGKEGKGIIICPIAFVSEHSETLVELDIEYKNLATENGVKNYIRLPALCANATFIEGLKQLVINSNSCEKRICPKQFQGCKNSD